MYAFLLSLAMFGQVDYTSMIVGNLPKPSPTLAPACDCACPKCPTCKCPKCDCHPAVKPVVSVIKLIPSGNCPNGQCLNQAPPKSVTAGVKTPTVVSLGSAAACSSCSGGSRSSGSTTSQKTYSRQRWLFGRWRR